MNTTSIEWTRGDDGSPGRTYSPHKGGDITTWPAELQVREYPTAVAT